MVKAILNKDRVFNGWRASKDWRCFYCSAAKWMRKEVLRCSRGVLAARTMHNQIVTVLRAHKRFTLNKRS